MRLFGYFDFKERLEMGENWFWLGQFRKFPIIGYSIAKNRVIPTETGGNNGIYQNKKPDFRLLSLIFIFLIGEEVKPFSFGFWSQPPCVKIPRSSKIYSGILLPGPIQNFSPFAQRFPKTRTNLEKFLICSSKKTQNNLPSFMICLF